MKKFWKVVWKITKFALIIFFGASVLSVILFRFINPPFTPLMVIRLVEQSVHGQSLKLTKSWVSINEISPYLPIAVVASEDNRFTEHNGFDLDAIKKAREYNERKHGKKVRGASTISQQTAKNVFLWPQRSWIRKGFEVYFTVLIEFFWSKKRIMEVYLNVAEVGKGIYGAEAASETYFRKKASGLTRGEAALIAASIPNPLKSNPASPTAYLIGRQQWILWNMGNIGKVEW